MGRLADLGHLPLGLLHAVAQEFSDSRRAMIKLLEDLRQQCKQLWCLFSVEVSLKFKLGRVEICANLDDLEKCCKIILFLSCSCKKSASTRPKTELRARVGDLPKIYSSAHLAGGVGRLTLDCRRLALCAGGLLRELALA